MKTYTLHLPADAAPGDADALERAVLVRDGFSWRAFFFSFLWFFAHRLWLAGLIVLAAMAALVVLLQVLRVGALPTVAAWLLSAFLIGLEANSLRRWTLSRRGQPPVDVVSAADREEAETKSFARWLGTAPAAGPAPVRLPVPAPARLRPEPVIGLFPEAERVR